MTLHAAQKVNWLLLGSYVIVLGTLVWRHEMWRDELQTWTLVTHARSLGELVYIRRYEGHPVLWYLLLWPFARLSTDPVLLQLVHTSLAICTASLVVFYSPFRFWEKALLLFGYYLLFEYGVISRNYQPGVLLAFGIATLWPLATKRPLLIGLGLALLFQTNAFGMLVGLGIGAGWLLLLIREKQLVAYKPLIAILIAGAGLLLAWLSTATPPDATFNNAWDWRWRFSNLLDAIQTIYQGLFPIPTFQLNFWNTHWLSGLVLPVLLSLGCLLVIGWSFRKAPVSLVMFMIPALLIIAFSYSRYHGSVRHNGHYMISLIVSCWVWRASPASPQSGSSWLFQLLLVMQCVAGLYAAYIDSRFAFSMARPLARYLERTYPKTVAVAGSYNQLLTPVAAYLGRDVYTLSTKRWGSYVLWNAANWNEALLSEPDSVLFTRYLTFRREHPNSVLVMAYHPFSHPDVREGTQYLLPVADSLYRFDCVKAFAPAIVPDENYYIYQLKAVTKRGAR